MNNRTPDLVLRMSSVCQIGLKKLLQSTACHQVFSLQAMERKWCNRTVVSFKKNERIRMQYASGHYKDPKNNW